MMSNTPQYPRIRSHRITREEECASRALLKLCRDEHDLKPDWRYSEAKRVFFYFDSRNLRVIVITVPSTILMVKESPDKSIGLVNFVLETIEEFESLDVPQGRGECYVMAGIEHMSESIGAFLMGKVNFYCVMEEPHGIDDAHVHDRLCYDIEKGRIGFSHLVTRVEFFQLIVRPIMRMYPSVQFMYSLLFLLRPRMLNWTSHPLYCLGIELWKLLKTYLVPDTHVVKPTRGSNSPFFELLKRAIGMQAEFYSNRVYEHYWY